MSALDNGSHTSVILRTNEVRKLLGWGQRNIPQTSAQASDGAPGAVPTGDPSIERAFFHLCGGVGGHQASATGNTVEASSLLKYCRDRRHDCVIMYMCGCT